MERKRFSFAGPPPSGKKVERRANGKGRKPKKTLLKGPKGRREEKWDGGRKQLQEVFYWRRRRGAKSLHQGEEREQKEKKKKENGRKKVFWRELKKFRDLQGPRAPAKRKDQGKEKEQVTRKGNSEGTFHGAHLRETGGTGNSAYSRGYGLQILTNWRRGHAGDDRGKDRK